MGSRLLGRLARAFKRVAAGEALGSWSPSALDPYGLVAITDARQEAQREALLEKLVELPTPIVQEREREPA